MSEKDDSANDFLSYKEPKADQKDELLNQRNESSVLFSLSSLEQAGRDFETKKSEGDAADDASGLINIQHITAITQRGLDSAQEHPPAVEPMMIAPAPPARERETNPLLWAGIGLGVVALVGVAIVAIVLGSAGEPEPQRVVQKEIVREVESSDTKTRLALAEAARLEAEAKLAQAQLAQANPKTGAKTGPSPGAKATHPQKTPHASPAAASEPEPAEQSPPQKEGEKNIVDLLDKDPALSIKKGAPEAPSTAAAGKTLSKAQVQATIKKYNGRIQSCGADKNANNLTGTAWLSLKISKSGRVESASISDQSRAFQGSDVGGCILSVVRAMKFERADSDLSIGAYPFVIKK